MLLNCFRVLRLFVRFLHANFDDREGVWNAWEETIFNILCGRNLITSFLDKHLSNGWYRSRIQRVDGSACSVVDPATTFAARGKPWNSRKASTPCSERLKAKEALAQFITKITQTLTDVASSPSSLRKRPWWDCREVMRSTVVAVVGSCRHGAQPGRCRTGSSWARTTVGGPRAVDWAENKGYG